MQSFKTRKPLIFGILVLLSALLQSAVALLDGDPATTLNMAGIVSAVSMLFIALGLMASRQNNVTSEEAGASDASVKREIQKAIKQDDEKTTLHTPCIGFLLMLLVPMLMIGCTTPNFASINAQGKVLASTSTQSISRLGKQGEMQAAFNGVAPTQLNQDAKGTYMQTPGQGGWITFNPATSAVMLWSPKDTIIEGLAITPDPVKGQPSLKATRITANITNVAKVYADQFAVGVAAVKDMSKTEAQARLGAMQVAGEVAPDIVKVILDQLYPQVYPQAPENSSDVAASTGE